MLDTDEHGWATAPHHDGSLDAILLRDDGATCLLLYRSTDGVRRVVVLTGVHALDASGFRQGNTILSFQLLSPCDVADSGYDKLLRRLGWGTVPVLKGRVLFVMDASYGAEVIADCDHAEIEVWDAARWPV